MEVAEELDLRLANIPFRVLAKISNVSLQGRDKERFVGVSV